MKARNSAMQLIALIAIVMTAGVWGATSASAQASDSRFYSPTGMFGITQNQTARINVTRDDPFFQGDPGDDDDKVELTFVDGDGNILSQKVYELAAGKSAFLDLRGSDLPRTETRRTQIRAMVRYIGTPDTRTYMWTPTVEVFDNESGETRFLVPAVQKVMGPDSLPRSR
jgi:hypothetical protein